jgi:hypothetical protein
MMTKFWEITSNLLDNVETDKFQKEFLNRVSIEEPEQEQSKYQGKKVFNVPPE